MSTPGLFRTIRGVYIAGKLHRRDELLRLDDGETIALLLDGGKIEAADAKTAKRIKRHSPVTWSPKKDPPGDRNPWQHRASWEF